MRKLKREKQAYNYKLVREEKDIDLMFLVEKGKTDKNGNARCIVDLIENGEYKDSYTIQANYFFASTIEEELDRIIKELY